MGVVIHWLIFKFGDASLYILCESNGFIRDSCLLLLCPKSSNSIIGPGENLDNQMTKKGKHYLQIILIWWYTTEVLPHVLSSLG